MPPRPTESGRSSMVLRKTRIGTRLGVGFGIILAIMMVVTVGGTALGQKSRHDLMKVQDANSRKEAVANEMKALVLEQSAVMRNIGLHADLKAMHQDEDRSRRLGKM